jgi:hypothetical protein
VTFSVLAKIGPSTGTQITNQATVILDTNAPINTATWLNTNRRDAPRELRYSSFREPD